VVTYVGPTAKDEDEEQDGIALLQRLDAHFEDDYEMLFLAGGLGRAVRTVPDLPVKDLLN
jgi:hypothetical protein